MSQMLPTGRETEFRQHPYIGLAITRFGGIDPDLSDMNLGDHEGGGSYTGRARGTSNLKEMHNMRFEQPGTPTTRTGYRKFVITDHDVPI